MASERPNGSANPLRLDAARIREDFPVFRNRDAATAVHYLDNAATSQKPQAVLDAMQACYTQQHGPVHRGLYRWAEQATAQYEAARTEVARFIGAGAPGELLFTRSATESINLVAQGWAAQRLRPGDAVWVSRMEHHSNFLPWQGVCAQTGAQLRIIELHPDGTLNLDAADGLFDPRTGLIALCHVSNVLGTINPIRDITRRAVQHGIAVLVDAAQSVGHLPLNVQDLGCDFLAFSAHKMFGPTGIGALYVKTKRLEEMAPQLLGGGMVDEVGDETSTWTSGPAKFEAGSPHLAGAVGLAAAARYVEQLGPDAIAAHASELLAYALQGLRAIPDIRFFGPARRSQQAGILSFAVPGVHPHDLAQIAAEHGVAVRAGHHCCQPLMRHLGVAATARASFAPYNEPADVDALICAVTAACQLFR